MWSPSELNEYFKAIAFWRVQVEEDGIWDGCVCLCCPWRAKRAKRFLTVCKRYHLAVHIVLLERQLHQVNVGGVVFDEHDFAVVHYVYTCFCVGIVKRNVDPSPYVDSAQIFPP